MEVLDMGEDCRKYLDKYVAIKSYQDNKVVAFGDTIKDTYNRAKEKGCESPVIVFITDKKRIG